MELNLWGVLILAIGAVIGFFGNAIAKKLFKIEKPEADIRALIIRFIGLGAVIVGLLIAMKVI